MPFYGYDADCKSVERGKMTDLKTTPLYDLHQSLGAKMVDFAGYAMPVQYPLGIMNEHLHTRAQAGLFDVSHMGQLILHGGIDEALEMLIPQNVKELAIDRQRYGFFTNEAGGIDDDLMFARRVDHIYLVVNAACKEQDIAHLRQYLGDAVEVVTDRALLALQGPQAENALAKLIPDVDEMCFMDVRNAIYASETIWISRSGYTGEDGFEISLPAHLAERFARELLSDDGVEMIGLGARDSLRLEAGLCLYGQDINPTINPIEADLLWAIQKRRRENGGFIGADKILPALPHAPQMKRVGLLPEGRAPLRQGVEIFASETETTPVGHITSGGFGPTVGCPVAMGYIAQNYAQQGQKLWGELRGKRWPITVSALPFTPANFKR